MFLYVAFLTMILEDKCSYTAPKHGKLGVMKTFVAKVMSLLGIEALVRSMLLASRPK